VINLTVQAYDGLIAMKIVKRRDNITVVDLPKGLVDLGDEAIFESMWVRVKRITHILGDYERMRVSLLHGKEATVEEKLSAAS
jgi:hypothetical protein